MKKITIQTNGVKCGKWILYDSDTVYENGTIITSDGKEHKAELSRTWKNKFKNL